MSNEGTIEVQNIHLLYEETMLSIVSMAIKRHNEDPVDCLRFINSTSIQKIVLMEKYNQLVRAKELTPIESLPREEKNRLWDACKGYGVDMCRVLWLIENVK